MDSSTCGLILTAIIVFLFLAVVNAAFSGEAKQRSDNDILLKLNRKYKRKAK